MDFDSWAHSFCLACDKQVHSSNDAYCSEACRLADFEKTSTPSSQASSPGFTPPNYPWTSKSSAPGFYLSPAYDFTNAKPYSGNSPRQPMYKTSTTTTTSTSTTRALTPSSSHSSLCSMQSTSSTADAGQLSDKTKQELRAYAVSFEQVRMQRRRSY